MFASQHINTDPTPLYTVTLTGQAGSRYAGQSFTCVMRSSSEADAIATAHGTYPGCELAGVTVTYNRPEFDNTPNPILVALRVVLKGRDESARTETILSVLEDLQGYQIEYAGADEMEKGCDAASVEHLEHARKVLTRLQAAAA